MEKIRSYAVQGRGFELFEQRKPYGYMYWHQSDWWKLYRLPKGGWELADARAGVAATLRFRSVTAAREHLRLLLAQPTDVQLEMWPR